jgi:hypothetical protein
MILQYEERLMEQNTVAIPPNFARPTPRAVRLTKKASNTRHLFLFIILSLQLLCNIMACSVIYHDIQFIKYGKVTTAHVVSKAGNGKYAKPIKYLEFTANGKIVDETFTWLNYHADVEGNSTSLTYLPLQPSIYCIGNANDGRINGIVIYSVLGCLFLFAVFQWFFGTSKYYKSQLSLMRDGTAVIGKITKHESLRDSGGKCAIHYNFAILDVKYRGSQSVNKEIYMSNLDDQEVVILYNPSKPSDNALYLNMAGVTFDNERPLLAGS